jgi:hypothetical protein
LSYGDETDYRWQLIKKIAERFARQGPTIVDDTDNGIFKIRLSYRDYK